MKDKNYINKIKIIAEADIRNGNKQKLKDSMKKLIEKEDYEACNGIQQALNNIKK